MNTKATIPELRKRIILDLIRSRDSVSIHDIQGECDVSEITIRRDLSELEKKGLLIRTHGGATKKVVTSNLFATNNKRKKNPNRENKEYICKVAAGYIKNDDIIFIDCGSTLFYLTKYIARIESLTVITNSLPVVAELINFGNIKLILIGGEVANGRKTICGYSAKRNVSQYHANKAFIETDGVSLLRGLTSYDEDEASVTLKMTENADEVFLLCDSEKIEKDSFISFAPLSVLDHIVTDKDLDSGLMEKYKRNNVNVVNE